MQFKRTEELKTGMRLARPIYNKNGVLLKRTRSLQPRELLVLKILGLLVYLF